MTRATPSSERLEHAVDRGADELALVVGDSVAVPGGSALLEPLQLGPHGVGDLEGVGGRLAHDAEADRGAGRPGRTRSGCPRGRPRRAPPRRAARGSRSCSTTMMLRNSSGVARRESVFTVSSRCVDSRRPPGSSTFCLLIAVSTSCDGEAARGERRRGRSRCAWRSGARRRYRRWRRPAPSTGGRRRRASGSRSARAGRGSRR